MNKGKYRQFSLIVTILAAFFMFYTQPLFALCDVDVHQLLGQDEYAHSFFLAADSGAPSHSDLRHAYDCTWPGSVSLNMDNCDVLQATVAINNTKLTAKPDYGNVTASASPVITGSAAFAGSGVSDGPSGGPTSTIYLLNNSLRC